MWIQIKEKLERLRECDKSVVKNVINNFNLGFVFKNGMKVRLILKTFLKLTALLLTS